jgi:hypothetical protein
MKIRQLEAQDYTKMLHKPDLPIRKCGRLNTWHRFHMTGRYIRLRTSMSKMNTDTQNSRLSNDAQKTTVPTSFRKTEHTFIPEAVNDKEQTIPQNRKVN